MACSRETRPAPTVVKIPYFRPEFGEDARAEYRDGLLQLRAAVMSAHVSSLEPQRSTGVSEREWLKYAAHVWERLHTNPFVQEYAEQLSAQLSPG